MKKTVVFLFVFLLPLLSWAQDYVLVGEKLQQQRIRIVSARDIAELKTGITLVELVEKFGEPLLASVPQAVTWPRVRSEFNIHTVSREKIWRNGYWFFFHRSKAEANEQSQLVLKYVAWLPAAVDESEEAIQDQFKDMLIAWPRELEGNRVSTLMKSGEFSRW